MMEPPPGQENQCPEFLRGIWWMKEPWHQQGTKNLPGRSTFSIHFHSKNTSIYTPSQVCQTARVQSRPEDNVANETLVSLESAKWGFDGTVGWTPGQKTAVAVGNDIFS